MRRTGSFLGLITLVLGVLAVHSPSAHAAPPYGTDKWALIIGIDHFSGKTRTNVGSVGDANDTYNLLINNGWPQDHVRLLTDGNANQAAIRDGLNWLVDNSGPNSFSVFHYSGHVKQTRDKNGTHEFFWPADNKFLSDSEVSSKLQQLRGWAWVDVSGCEAQGLADNVASDRHLVTASSQVNEKSYEDPHWHNSVFTGFMVDMGMLRGNADSNSDGRVTLQEAFNFAAANAPGYTNSQKQGPQHPVTAGGDGTEWLLNPPPPPPPPPPAPNRSCMVNLPGVPGVPCL